jgi:hypothetical protein
LPPGDSATTRLAAVPCTGTRIHDAHIVASAMVHEVKTTVSLDTDDFAPFLSHIAAITLQEASARSGGECREDPAAIHAAAAATHSCSKFWTPAAGSDTKAQSRDVKF